MADDSLREQLSKLERSSPEYARLATALSDSIENVVNRLKELPGKFPLTISNSPIPISFRREGDQWEVFIGAYDDEVPDEPLWEPICNVSIDRKANAVDSIKALIAGMRNAQESRLGLLRAATTELEGDDDVPF